MKKRVTIKTLDKRLSALRKEIIAELKKVISKRTLAVSDNDVFIQDSNTEDLITFISSKGFETEYGKERKWNEVKADLLLLLLKVINKNSKKFF